MLTALTTFKVVDAHGRVQRVPSAPAVRLTIGRKTPAIERARALARVHSPDFAARYSVWLWIGVLIITGPALFELVRGDAAASATLTRIILLGVGIGLILLRHRWVTDEIARVERLYGPMPRVCIMCGYDLDGLRTTEEGVCICPECGAAWRLPQSVSVAPSGNQPRGTSLPCPAFPTNFPSRAITAPRTVTTLDRPFTSQPSNAE